MTLPKRILQPVILLGAVLVLIRLVLAWIFPVFADEAYYLYWGSHFSGGYYDLPPMIGWWLWPLLKISSHPFWIRIFNFSVSLLIAKALADRIGHSRGVEASRVSGLLFLALPLPFLTVISFPDLPLLFFCFFSALLFHHGVLSQRRFLSLELVASGSLWGSAFLSKYFALFLIPGFLLWAWPRSNHRLGGVLSFVLGAVPFGIQHLLWNRGHCWSNIIFNLITRQQAFEGTAFATTGFLILHLIGVGLTVLPFMGARAQERSKESGDLEKFFFFLWVIPVLIFFVTALSGRGQGLHWLLFLTPFFIGWFSLRSPVIQIRRAAATSAVISSILGLVLCLAFAFPERLLARTVGERFPFEFSVITDAPSFFRDLRPELEGVQKLFTQSYSLSSLLEYEFERSGMRDFPATGVLESGSRFGRVFDFTANWKSLEGSRIAILKTGSIEPSRYESFFTAYKMVRGRAGSAEYSILVGEGFKARDYWLQRVLPELNHFYPAVLGGNCPIREEFDVR